MGNMLPKNFNFNNESFKTCNSTKNITEFYDDNDKYNTKTGSCI